MPNEYQLRQLIRQEISNNTQTATYGVTLIPYHTHNGTDSPLIASTTSGATYYKGYISGAGSLSNGPSGWSCVRNSAGKYTITHNLNSSVYTVIPVSYKGEIIFVSINNQGVNSFDINVYTSAGSPNDGDVTFTLFP